MHIAHIAIWTRDLARASQFYSEYFAASVSPLYHNASKGFSSCFLSFASGCKIELMHSTQLAPIEIAAGAHRMGFTHLGLHVGSSDAVDSLTERLRSDGYSVIGEPRRTGDGFYESIVRDPDGNRIEITG